MCGISQALHDYHNQVEKEDYYGLKLLKLCLEKHFKRLVKYVSIQGRSTSSFGFKYQLPGVRPDFTKDICYNQISSGTFSRTGGISMAEEYSSVPGVRAFRPGDLMKVTLDLPENYVQILDEFETLVKGRVLSDKTNEAVKLSHTQESHCNESDYTNFQFGFVYHAIYV